MNSTISWRPPQPEWIKINTDGSLNRATGMGSTGGIIRNNSGEWCGDFICNIGFVSVVEAELQGLMHGLELAWRLNFRRVYVEINSLEAYNLVNDHEEGRGYNCDIVRGIEVLMNREWVVTLEHIYREANLVADCLASLGATILCGIQWL